MKVLHELSTGSFGKALELWMEGKITDVLMTPYKISGYCFGDCVFLGEYTEDEIREFISETVPADMEQLWTSEIREGKLVKYSFVLKEVLVRCVVWNFGVAVRFLPLYVKEDAVKGRFFIIHTGKVRSGKTVGVLKNVRFLSKRMSERIFIYSDVQEIYVPDAEAQLVYIDEKHVKNFSEFINLARAGATTAVIQKVKDWNKLLELYESGVNIIAESYCIPSEIKKVAEVIEHG